MSRKSYCTIPGVGEGGGVGVSKKLNVKVFYVMGKRHYEASYPVPVTGLVYFYLSKKIRLDFSCETSAWQRIHLKHQVLFSLKKKK